MKKGTLIIQPLGGLANRMRVISICYQLSLRANANFKVVWIANSELGAKFTELFNDPPFDIFEVHRNSYLYAYKSKKWYRRLQQYLWACLHGYKVLTAQDVGLVSADKSDRGIAIFQNYIVTQLKVGKHLFMSTGDWLGTVTDLSMFVPRKYILDRVDQFSYSFPSNIYGIHIRRTDNTWSIENSPLCLFENKISSILLEEPTAMFYLATDDRETINHLKKLYGSHILVREKDFSRTSLVGIQDAIIDMWLLSRTKCIFGSYYSSFSEMASWIGRCELEVLKLKETLS